MTVAYIVLTGPLNALLFKKEAVAATNLNVCFWHLAAWQPRSTVGNERKEDVNELPIFMAMSIVNIPKLT